MSQKVWVGQTKPNPTWAARTVCGTPPPKVDVAVMSASSVGACMRVNVPKHVFDRDFVRDDTLLPMFRDSGTLSMYARYEPGEIAGVKGWVRVY